MTGRTFKQRVSNAKGLGRGIIDLTKRAVNIPKRYGNVRRDGNAPVRVIHQPVKHARIGV